MDKSCSVNSQSLVKLGLSQHEARVYETLLKEGPMTARELAKKMQILINAVYRLLDRLEEKGLVFPSSVYPRTYRAISASTALDAYVKKKIVGIESLKDEVIDQLSVVSRSDQTRIDLISSMSQFFSSYVQLASEAKKEILIISIGEKIPEEVILANRDALEREVCIRFIAHRYNKENKDLLSAWKKMGLEVRHFDDWGFHLVIFDRQRSLICTNNPSNTNERLGMKIFSERLSKALSDYFYSVWDKAVVVE